MQARTQKRRTKFERDFANGESAQQHNQEYQPEIEAELHQRTLPEPGRLFEEFLRVTMMLN
jgi:hypothetical protein